MFRGDAGQPTRARLLQTAFELLGRDDFLPGFGIAHLRIATAAGFARNAVKYHFASPDALLRAMRHDHRRQMQALVEKQAGQYRVVGDLMERDDWESVAKALRVALTHDLQAYLPDGSDLAAVGRERFYWLCVAFAGRTSKRAIEIAEEIRETNRQTQLAYAEVYTSIGELTGRRPKTGDRPEDWARMQRIVNTFLEGYIVHQRLGREDESDEMIDGVISLIFGLTEPVALPSS